MAETRFTPGPWRYGIAYMPKLPSVPYDYKSGHYYDNTGVIGADGTTVVGCDEYHVFNSAADVALIAAAPELYEALEQFAAWFGPIEDNEMLGDECRACFALARAALAKARGEA